MGGLCGIERRGQETTRRKTRNFYPKLLRAGIEAVPRKRIKYMSGVVQLCARVHVHTWVEFAFIQGFLFTVDSFAPS